MKKVSIILLLFVLCCGVLLCGSTSHCYANMAQQVSNTANCQSNSDLSDIIDDVSNLFTGTTAEKITEQVYLGGYPLGITIDGDGVTIIGLNEFFNSKG